MLGNTGSYLPVCLLLYFSSDVCSLRREIVPAMFASSEAQKMLWGKDGAWQKHAALHQSLTDRRLLGSQHGLQELPYHLIC